MANFKKVVSFIVSNTRNKFKGTFTTHSSLLSFRNTSSFLELDTGIFPPKTIFAPLINCFNHLKLFNHRRSHRVNTPKDCELVPIMDSMDDFGFGEIYIAIASLKEKIELGVKPNAKEFTMVIYRILSRGMDDCALELLREIAFHQGIIPYDIITYNSLLNAIRVLSRRHDLSKMLKDIDEKGIFLHSRTFNIVVDAYCQEGRMEDAESIVNLMIKRNTGPDRVTYRCLIDGYSLQGDISKSREVFDSFRCSGMFTSVDVYNSLLKGYFKVSMVEEAMHLFDEIMKNGVKLNAITYDSMGLFRVGDCASEAIFFSDVPLPKESTFKVVLEGLCNNNRVDEAISLFLSMGDKKLNSNIDLYNILIDGASKNGELRIARVLFNELITTKGLQPNADTYAAMIIGYCQEGLLGESKELYLEMKEKGLLPNNATCNLLLRGFLKNQQRDIAEMLTQEMIAKRFKFDVRNALLMIKMERRFQEDMRAAILKERVASLWRREQDMYFVYIFIFVTFVSLNHGF